VTVGGGRDKVKPNGENRRNSAGARAVPRGRRPAAAGRRERRRNQVSRRHRPAAGNRGGRRGAPAGPVCV